MQVRKRSKELVPFDQTKIATAINKAIIEVEGEPDEFLAGELAVEVVGLLDREEDVHDIEDIQDLVERVLMAQDYFEVAKAYILYREQRRQLREMKALVSVDLINEYIGQHDWRVKENANSSFSLQGLNNYVANTTTAHYWLEKAYPASIREAHRSGAMHTHDLGSLSSYCCGFDLKQLLDEGLNGVPNQVAAGPAKRLGTALGQVVNFMYTIQGEIAGAVAFSAFDTYLAPYVRKDRLSEDQVCQAMQEFMFNMNIPTRTGYQTPFTNITMDMRVPRMMAEEPVVIGGQTYGVYGDYEKEMEMINRAFARVMTAGDRDGRGFTFPIPTYNVDKDFTWNPTVQEVMVMTAKYGTPYFANFINSTLRPEDVRSMCPLHPKTKVPVRTSKGITVRSLRDLFCTSKRAGTSYEVLINGQWVKGTLVSNPTVGCVEIKTSNGAKTTMDLRHEQPVKRQKGASIELLTASQIEPGMYLPYNTVPIPDTSSNYEAGFAVGAFLGDGSLSPGGHLTYSLNDGKKKLVLEKVQQFFTSAGFVCTSRLDGSVSSLYVYGEKSTATAIVWMRQFISGNSAHSKRLTPRAFRMGQAFLRGVLDGWYLTDGGNRGRVYTVNSSLVLDFQTICSLLGIPYRIDLDHPDKRDGRLGDSPVYTAKFHTRPSYGNVYFLEDGYWWFKVEAIKPSDYTGNVYCFTVDSDDHLFQLGNGLVTHNCRLSLDLSKLRSKGGGLFGANPMTGSIGVCTLNLPRAAYLSENEAEYFSRLEHLVHMAVTSLEIKRDLVEYYTEIGLYPYVHRYMRHIKQARGSYWANHFGTVGLVGGNEACLNLFGEEIWTPRSREFTEQTLNFLNGLLVRHQERTGNLYNLEATPAEGTSYRLARLDKQAFRDIVVANEEAWRRGAEPYYSNSTQLPVGYTDDIYAMLRHQEGLQTLYTGGTACHLFMGEDSPDPRGCFELVKSVLSTSKVPYVSLTPTWSVCPECGYLPGEQYRCPKCSSTCEVNSRPVGYYRPISQWNDGKLAEYRDRALYKPRLIRAA